MQLKALLPGLHEVIERYTLPDYLLSLCRKVLDEQSSLSEVMNDIRNLNVHESVAKSDFVSLALNYFEIALEDDNLSEAEKSEIQILKRVFRIKSEDFVRYQPLRVEHIINKNLDKIYEDDSVNFYESVFKDDLQEILGMSYDDMNDYVKRWARISILKGGKVENLDVLFTHEEYTSLMSEKDSAPWRKSYDA